MINYMIKLSRKRIIGKIGEVGLTLLGVSIPREVKIGKGVNFVHNAPGTIIHPDTIIKDNVKIYQGVTLGRADIHRSFEESKMKGILIEEGAIICAGAKILCKGGILKVGKNTIIGANSVLTQSTGDNEIWAGVPAKKN